MCQFEFYLSEKSFNRLERIEERFPEGTQVNNPEFASWITIPDQSLELTHRNKIKLMLEFCFTHWLQTIYEEHGRPS